MFVHLWAEFNAGAKAIVEYGGVYLHIIMAEWTRGCVMNQGPGNKLLM